MTFDEWYDTVVKYVTPADIYQWMFEAWEAGQQAEQDKMCSLLRQLHDSISLRSKPMRLNK